jgi:hypothetical protein
MVHNSTYIKKGKLQNGTVLQHGKVLQNGTVTKWYMVEKTVHFTQNNMLQSGTATKWSITKRYTDIMVCYITVHYSCINHGLVGH